MSIFSISEVERRHAGLRAATEELDAVAAFSFTDGYYLSGAPIIPWGRPTIVVVPRSSPAVMILAGQERHRAATHTPIADLRTYEDAEGPSALRALDLLAALLAERGIRRLGVDGHRAPFAMVERLRRTVSGLEVVDVSEALEDLRVVSSPEEIAYLRAAAAVTDQGMRAFLSEARIGMPEVALAGRVSAAMADFAARRYPDVELKTSCYSQQGKRSLQPHTAADGSPLAAGQLICIVIEAHAWFYQAAIERAVALGEVSAELARYQQAIARSQETAIDMVAPGVACSAVDRAARRVLEEAGHTDIACGTGLVRNIINEWEGRIDGGNLRLYNDAPLRPGMMLTVEPWAVEPEMGAPRNCDMVLVTEAGHEVVSQVERGALRVG